MPVFSPHTVASQLSALPRTIHSLMEKTELDRGMVMSTVIHTDTSAFALLAGLTSEQYIGCHVDIQHTFPQMFIFCTPVCLTTVRQKDILSREELPELPDL